MLRSLVKRWDDYFTAISFAEAGEFDLARFFMKKKKEKAKSTGWDEVFTAITFAEAGEFDTARMILQSKRRVLLVIEEEVDREILSYVEGLCKRLDIPVEILLFKKSDLLSSSFNQFLDQLKSEGLLFKVSYVEGSERLEKVLTEYLSSNEGIDFLIVKPSLAKTEKEDERLIKSLWEKLGFPLILVKERGAH